MPIETRWEAWRDQARQGERRTPQGDAMHFTMLWFLPVGATTALFGIRTAVVEKRARGGHWRRDSILLAVTVCLPLVIWLLACLIGPFD